MKGILITSIAFSPNMGGIETHFDDLVNAISKEGIKNWVLTYKPITTKVSASFFEKRGEYTEIYRIPWISGIFYSLVKNSIVEFIYLVPGLFVALPILLLLKMDEIQTIHSHGLVAGFVSVFWGKIFGKKVITTTHSIYNFPQKGMYKNFAQWIFDNSDTVLTLSKQSKEEIKGLGVKKGKIKSFTYWVNQKIFKEIPNAKRTLGWLGKFIVFSAGRLVPEKGINELIEASSNWNKNITLVVAGTGTLEQKIKKIKRDNFIYLGRKKNTELPLYFSAADLFIIPSTHEEGFGRNILEALSCGTPVIGSSRGAISEAMNETVGKMIDISPHNIKKTVEYFYKNTDKLQRLSKNARHFAIKRYSEKNAETIIKTY